MLNDVFGHNFVDVMFDVLELIFGVVFDGKIELNPSEGKFDPFDDANLTELFHILEYKFLDVLFYCFGIADVVFDIFLKLNEDLLLDIVERDLIDSLF